MDISSQKGVPEGSVPQGHSIVVTMGEYHEKPWWWNYLRDDHHLCPLSYERIAYRSSKAQFVSVLESPLVMLIVLYRLIRWRRTHEYIFTFECDMVGLSVAFWQSLLRMKKPKHVILQFIMRERSDTLSSKVKYRFMRFLFSSVSHVIVSSRAEIEYYTEVFGWPQGKARFVQFHTDPALVESNAEAEGDYILAAGRTFRDYDTLIKAASNVGRRAIIVGGTGTRSRYENRSNIEIMENIPQSKLRELMLNARVVVVPLENRKISVGQSVILEAMGCGKAVVATRTAGTVDYIQDMVDGILVSPEDVDAMTSALQSVEDDGLRRKLGAAARKRVLDTGLPHHYSSAVRAALAFP